MHKTQTPNKSFIRNRRISIAVFCLGFGWLIYSFSYLRIEAWRNKNYLNGIVILEGQKTVSSARPNGDFLTGSSSPAYAEFSVDDSLENLYKSTMANLKDQGYSSDNYADTSFAGDGFQKVAVKSTKGSKSIVLEYTFDKKIMCDATNSRQKPCYFDSYKDIYGTGLKDMRISKLKVFYDNN